MTYRLFVSSNGLHFMDFYCTFTGFSDVISLLFITMTIKNLNKFMKYSNCAVKNSLSCGTTQYIKAMTMRKVCFRPSRLNKITHALLFALSLFLKQDKLCFT